MFFNIKIFVDSHLVGQFFIYIFHIFQSKKNECFPAFSSSVKCHAGQIQKSTTYNRYYNKM